MGTNQRHDNPFLCNIGSRHDGLGRPVDDQHATCRRPRSASRESKIGENNYLGNDIHYPPDGKTGANVLLGTKTMIPIDGPVRENVGLLGSPAFEIPRMVDRDRDMNASIDEATRRARLRRKNAYNAVTAGLFLLCRWMAFFAALVLWAAAIAAYDRFGVFALLAGHRPRSRARTSCSSSLIERASLGFQRLEPKLASIYDPYFWFHERHWKLSDSPITSLFAGTPFRNIMMRAIGMKVGKMVFDCSQSITERTLTEVGDYANLNEGSVLQAHSLEEGVFKSDHIRMGSGCSIGPGAFVHYGVMHGRSCRARRRLLPDEGRGARPAHRLARQPGQDDAQLTRRRAEVAATLRLRADECVPHRGGVESRCWRRWREAAMSGGGQAQGRDGRKLARGRSPRACCRSGGSGRRQSLFDRRVEVRSRRASARGLCRRAQPVGFLMYDVSDEGKKREASIYRFMIDRRHQGKGYGRAALVLALEEIRAIPKVRKVSISYMPDNKVAKAFYASLGFVEAGVDEDGEMMAELAL